VRFAEIFKTELFSKYGQKAGCYINEIYDIIHGRILQRVIQNVFGVVFAFVFCAMFYLFTSNKKKTGVTADAE